MESTVAIGVGEKVLGAVGRAAHVISHVVEVWCLVKAKAREALVTARLEKEIRSKGLYIKREK